MALKPERECTEDIEQYGEVDQVCPRVGNYPQTKGVHFPLGKGYARGGDGLPS